MRGCPVCDGEVQATVKRYVAWRDGKWVEFMEEEWEYYCENDHTITAELLVGEEEDVSRA